MKKVNDIVGIRFIKNPKPISNRIYKFNEVNSGRYKSYREIDFGGKLDMIREMIREKEEYLIKLKYSGNHNVMTPKIMDNPKHISKIKIDKDDEECGYGDEMRKTIKLLNSLKSWEEEMLHIGSMRYEMYKNNQYDISIPKERMELMI